jgi:Asp/Glu/hydantoin racemase
VHNCRWANEYIPSLARSKDDQEDAEIDGEATHCCDAIRIACATRPIVKDKKQEAPERTIGMSESPMEILKRIKRQRYARY